jgi:16S rRNA (cytidine1402-2'-O)-methyltransferase
LKPSDSGTLYIVATPIGNLADISQRAIDVLGIVDTVAAEDTRHTSRLMQALGLSKKMLALHDHNELARHEGLLDRVATGESIALVSDAGTPLISDPGFVLVRAARQRNIPVVPVPGACALIAALSAAGLPTDRFAFEGFLPAKRKGREDALISLQDEVRTLVFYEAPHRILETAAAIVRVMGDDREVVLARELTKTFETFYHGAAADVARQLNDDENATRGEFVVMVAGAPAQPAGSHVLLDADRLLQALLPELPVKAVARVVSQLTGESKNALYQRALELKP